MSFMKHIQARDKAASDLTFERCRDLADSWEIVGKKTSETCEQLYPDYFVAEYIGKRGVKLWKVDYSWGSLVHRLWAKLR